MKIPVACPKPAKGKRAKPQGLKTRSPMKRTKFKTRGKRTKRSGGALFPKNVDEARRDFIRSLPCVLAGRSRLADLPGVGVTESHYCYGPVRACHLKSRGAGGKDAANMYPGCDAAHNEQHVLGVPKFERRWSVNLAAECARREAEYLVGAAPSPDPRP